MASSLAEADELVRLAAARGVQLAVGHTERFNPAVQAALPLVATPRFIEVHRLSGFPDRSLDIDVIFDVMIHDLDILLAVDSSGVASVEASYEKKQAVVTFDDSKASVEALMKATANAGYPSTLKP